MTAITDWLPRIEACYDAIPRVGGARVEEWGPFVLFVREPPGWPYYARPRPGATSARAADVAAVRARQRELGMPEAFEWVHDVSPAILGAVTETGLEVLHAPLMVLDRERLAEGAPPVASAESAASGAALRPSQGDVELLDPDAPDFAERRALSAAVARIGFRPSSSASPRPSEERARRGRSQSFSDAPDAPAGPAERDAAVAAPDPAAVELAAATIRSGHLVEAVLSVPGEGVVARGGLQRAEGAAEIVGVATLPTARRRGYGAAVSAALARHALDRGDDLVFLSAASDEVARVYARIGFRRVGTACIAGPPPV